jgi:hypothetical protein
MSLEGLRAWIGEVERKLGMRTRVFLVLTVIAVGGAGAAIYLAIDARESSVSESDVQALQQKLEARIDEGGSGVGETEAAKLEAEINALQAEVKKLKSEGGGGEGKSGASAEGGGGASVEGAGAGSGGATAGTSGTAAKTKLQAQAEKANEQSAQTEVSGSSK